MRLFIPTLFFLVISLCSHHVESAHCERCTRIEAEREREQALNPKPMGYYDDFISLRESEKEAKNTVANNTHPVEAKNALTVDTSLLALATKSPLEEVKNDLQDQDKHIKIAPSNSQEAHYSTVYTLLQTKNLLAILDNGNYTLFVPTDDALRRLSDNTLEILSQNHKEELSELISNHIVPDNFILKKNFNGKEVKALSGRNLELNKDKQGRLTVDEIPIIGMVATGNNGVIYIIDGVLIP